MGCHLRRKVVEFVASHEAVNRRFESGPQDRTVALGFDASVSEAALLVCRAVAEWTGVPRAGLTRYL